MGKTRLTRRNFLQLTGGALAISALAACVPGGGAPAPEADAGAGADAPAAEPGSLWVLHKQDFYPQYNEFIRQHVVDFAAENNIQLDIAYTAGFGGGDIVKVAAAVQAGESPDVWIDNVSPFQLYQLGLTQPVTDLQNEVNAKWGTPAPRANKEAFLDGEYVGCILHCRSDGGWSRNDVFGAAGIDQSTIRTYDELREAAMAVSDPAKEMWGWGMTVNRGGDGNWFITRVLHGWGATWVDETGQFVTLDSPEAVAAVEWLIDLYTNPQWELMMPPGVLSWTDTSNNEAYLGGKVAYTQNAGTVYANAISNGLEVAALTDYDPPKGGPVMSEFNGLGGMNAYIVTGAPNPTASRDLVMSFFTDEFMESLYGAAVAYAVPAYEAHWDWPVITNDRVSTALKPVALDPSGWNVLAWPGPPTAQIGAVDSASLQTELIANVLTGGMSPAESVAAIAEASVKIFQEFGAPGVQG